MKRYDVMALIALLIIVAALPVYAVVEPRRMERAQEVLREEFLVYGAEMYVDNCAYCHGARGEGIGVMPPLNNPAIADADHDLLYRTIAHSPHGSAMAAWHVEEGGILSDYQVEGLVTLIRHADWGEVEAQAVAEGFVPPIEMAPEMVLATMEGSHADQVADPHECRACHEEPDVHAEQFGLNCSRCHTLEAWQPARLTRHTFLLSHGDRGTLACQTCHTETYSEYTCYGCHDDHTPQDMEDVHAEEGIFAFEDCAVCHPTGQPDEGEEYRHLYETHERAIPFQGPGEEGVSSVGWMERVP